MPITRNQLAKRRYNLKHRQKKRQQGWRSCSFVVPPEVLKGVREAKNRLMADWRKKQKEAPVQELCEAQ